MTDKIAWTEHEAAEALGVSDRTLRAWRVRPGAALPFKRIGGIVLYSQDALREWLRTPYDDQKEDGRDQGPKRSTRAAPAEDRQMASRSPGRRGKPRASKPRLPVGLLGE